MASYLDNKHSPTVKSLEKLNFVVSPEDKTNTQLGNAVINDIREDCARTTLSVITSDLNVQKEHKLYASFLISSELQSFLVFLSIKVQHDFSEVNICVRTRLQPLRRE
jgi:hypothetical protein